MESVPMVTEPLLTEMVLLGQVVEVEEGESPPFEAEMFPWLVKGLPSMAMVAWRRRRRSCPG